MKKYFILSTLLASIPNLSFAVYSPERVAMDLTNDYTKAGGIIDQKKQQLLDKIDAEII